METVEILAGGQFAHAINDLDLVSAKCTYHYHPPAGTCREEYQVWLLSKADFDNLCAINDDDWKENWGWWRYATGSNLGSANHEYIVHGVKIVAWDGYKRIEWKEVCDTCCSDRKRGLCEGTIRDFDECFGKREYPDLITYLCDEIGASTEKNVCACTVDLAQQNNMTLSELFRKHLGGESE